MSGAVDLPWAPTPYRLYGPDEEPRLRADLERTAAHTDVVDIEGVEDVRMDLRGNVRGGLRYTQIALKQLLAGLCPGAYTVVTRLALGRVVESGEGLSPDLAAAAGVFNTVVASRIGALADQVRLLHNLADRTLDGTLGPRYILLGNDEFLDRLREALADEQSVVFEGASLHGRRLVARYRSTVPVFDGELAGRRETFFQGWHLSNSEVGGEASAYLAVTLARDGGGSALKKLKGCWVRHLGKFHVKLSRAIAAATAFRFDRTRLEADLRRLALTPLPHDRAAERRLVAAIHQDGAPARLARNLVRGASGDADGLDPVAPRLPLRPGSQLDLFYRLCDGGTALHHRVRESLERSAFDLLTDRL